MKIAIICYNHFDATISLGKYLSEADEGVEVNFIFILSQSFLNIEIFSLQNKGVGNGFLDQATLERTVDKEVFNYLGRRISFDIFVFNSYKIADAKNFKLVLELRNAIQNRGYDVAHLVGNNRWVILLNALLRKLPKLHTLHEPYPFTKDSSYRLKRHKLKINLLIRTGCHLILPSNISYQRFIKHFRPDLDSVSIIPFGPLEIFKEYKTKNVIREANVILYYGNISSYKGIDVLIAAMQLISKANPDLRLIVAGGGNFDYVVQPPIKQIEIINRHLSNNEIADLNSLATIVVCPYTAASQSGVVMTSFAFNNPIVASNVGALAEFVEDGVTGVIIEPGDPETLSKAIVDLFSKPGAIEKMRLNIEKKYAVSDKGWSKIAEQTFQLYLKQIDKKKTSEIRPGYKAI